MTKFFVEVVAHGRLNLVVEAEDLAAAEVAAFDHPDFPDFDKVYESSATVIGEAS